MSKQVEVTGSLIKPKRLLEPKRIPEGFLLTDPDDAWSWGKFAFGFLFLSFWCGVSFPMFAGTLFLFITAPSFSFGALFHLLFISIFAAIGVIGIVWGIRELIVIAKLKPGEVILRTYPLRMGESCRLRYRRQLRNGSTRKPGKITAKWLCYEWVQYRQGKNTKTVTHTLWETDLPEKTVSSWTKQLEYYGQVQVLTDGPPSFDAANNQVRWELQVTVNLPGVPKDTSYFRFKILPEVLK